MSSRVGRLVDVEKLVATWLRPHMPAGVRVLTRLPADLSTGKFVWVAAVPGSTDGDNALLPVDLQVLVPGGPGAAVDLAATAHQAMGDLTGGTVSGQDVNVVTCPTPPTPRFWSNEVDRMVATYELDLPVYD